MMRAFFFRLSFWALFGAVVDAVYMLETSYDSTNFFREFGFFDGPNPTHGYVEYVDASNATELDLAGDRDGLVYMGVDHTTVDPANGRKSVRLTSNKLWSRGLFVADIVHMPGSLCGLWPAMWLHGPDWPVCGEIDIIEGVNSQSSNIITLHTSPGCTIDNTGTTASTVLNGPDCNLGCSQITSDPVSYGNGFNQNGGGVYALEWTSSHISVWFFSRRHVPLDITNQEPNPSSWDQPAARFNGDSGCSIDGHFHNNNLIFDTTFCGDWAGTEVVWEADVVCSAVAGGKTCVEFVATNPSEFIEAYWLIDSIRIYQQDDANEGTAGNYSSPGTYLSP